MSRKKRAFRIALGALLLLNASAKADEGTVIWLSWDGVRHDFPLRGDYPGLTRMAQQGARAERLTPVYPSSTFPNHVAMATCTHSDRHGIIENEFWDRDRGSFSYVNDASWLQAEPIWVAAERQGVVSASYYWVGSETDWNGIGARHRISPFDAGVREEQKVDQILAWLDLPGADRPRLILSWWHGADRSGHLKGPDHPDVAKDLAEQDIQLQRLMAGLDARGLWPQTTLIVSSDHGMTEASRKLDLAEVLEAAGIAARVRSGAAVANVYLAQTADLEKAKGAISELEGVEVFRRDEVPESLRLRHRQRSGDLVIVTEPPYFFASRRPSVVWTRWFMQLLGHETGHHGYSISHPDMAGILYLMGRGAKGAANLGVISNLDIAPTVALLLGIDPPRDCEGRAILESQRVVSPFAGSD